MKIIFIFLAIQYCIVYNNSFLPLNEFVKNEITQNITKPVRRVEDIIKEFQNSDAFINISYNIRFLIDFKYIDNECKVFLNNSLADPKIVINYISKRLLKSGLSSNTIEGEEGCLNNNNVYILFKKKYLKLPIYKNYEQYENQKMLFIESFTSEEEICLYGICKDFFINYKYTIMKFISNNISKMFMLDNFQIMGLSYKINEKTKYDIIFDEGNKEFNKILIYIFYIFLIIIIICTIYYLYKENLEENEEENKEKENFNKKTFVKIINDDKAKRTKSEVTIFSKKSYENEKSKIFKFFNAFNIVNNFILLNKKKELLSNQNSLTELSIFIFITLFFILLAENTFIIIKYVDKGRTLLYFLKKFDFIIINISFHCYEYYKIICGIIFGYKFINYLKKSKDYNTKRIFKFFFKFIPYFISFLIIYFILQYQSVEFTSFMKKSLRIKYISKKIKDCYYCHKEFYNIFNPLMLGKYNSTESYPAQYDGCLRTTLFTVCEFICYLFIVLLFSIFIKIKSKICEIIFLIINIIILPLTFIITPEGRDLKYFSLSRLFGLSASISLPYLFFPLYYIGFNIGIIYYYNLHQSEAYRDLNKKENNYIPFEYCFRLSLFLSVIKDKFKYGIIGLCLFLIFIINMIFHRVINHENKLFFKFNIFTKFIYVYEGIFCGIFFSILIVFYLSLNSQNILRIVLTSDFLFFINKISFILFNIIIPSLKIFHGLNIIGIYFSTLNIFLNSISLYIIIIFIVIIFSILIFYPIKWINFFILNGFDYDEYE